MNIKTKRFLITETSRSLLEKMTYYMNQVDTEHAGMILGLKATVKHIHDNATVEIVERAFEAIVFNLESAEDTMWDIVLENDNN